MNDDASTTGGSATLKFLFELVEVDANHVQSSSRKLVQKLQAGRAGNLGSFAAGDDPLMVPLHGGGEQPFSRYHEKILTPNPSTIYSDSNPKSRNFRVWQFSLTMRTTCSEAPSGMWASISRVMCTRAPTTPARCEITSSAI